MKHNNNELYKDKDWLYQKYITENLGPVEIAELLGLPRRLGSKRIDWYLSQFGFKKDKTQVKEAMLRARNKNNLEKYGNICSLHCPENTAKTKQTNLKKYGSENHQGHPDITKKRLQTKMKAGYVYNIDGMTINEFLNSTKDKFISSVSTCTIQNLIKELGFQDKENISQSELEEAFVRNVSNIEFHIEKEMGLIKYSKCFDLESYPELKYFPDFKLSDKIALNVDGLYYHSELKKEKNYHFEMRKDFENVGLRILQFRQDEVLNKMPIVKSIIHNSLNQTENKVGARKTTVKIVKSAEAKIFLDQNHIKGYKHAKHIGLYYNEELIQILSYIVKKNVMKIERLCGKINWSVIGGYSKLEKFALTNEKRNIKSIQYWVDLRYGTGKFLENLGYQHQRDTLGWEWTDKHKTYNRLQCRANMDSRKLSEREHAKELGWIKIYDAGQRLYEKMI